MISWLGKKVIVVGLARTGIAVAQTLQSLGALVFVTDAKTKTEFEKEKIELEEKGIQVETGGHSLDWLDGAQLVVVSPGVPLEIPYLQEARTRGIEILGELELAFRFSQAPFVAITGTNGKTTTTSLMGEVMKAMGKKVVIGGNIGFPLINEVRNLTNKDIVVAEVSSFQLETTKEFRPKVSAILNLTEDHLDRHKTLENYLGAKCKIFTNQGLDDFLVLNADDPFLEPLDKKSSAQTIFFSRQKSLPSGIYLDGEEIVSTWAKEKEVICRIDDIKIKGAHNLENALAVIAVAEALALDREILVDTLRTFSGVEHRLEFVLEKDGVRFYNDSKGTNPDAAIKALEAFNEPIVLIAGGRDKGVEYVDFAERIKQKSKALILLGEAAQKIEGAVIDTGFANIHKVNSMEEAVEKGYQLAEEGDVVLLSPACASFDMFKNYEVRGEVFKKAVKDLA